MKMKTFWIVLKGFIVGATMLVPGVSGGSMAMILGIYDELIQSVNSFIKKKSMITLFLFCIGGISGVILFSYPMLYLLEHYYMHMMYLFIGCVIASISFIKRKSGIIHFQMKHFSYISIGIVCVTLFSYLPSFAFDTHMSVYIIAGFLLAIALVLPGISVSYVMVLFGIYEPIIIMIQEWDVIGLIPIVLGGMAGVLTISHLLEYLLKEYGEITYLIIFGFVVGSIVEIFPGFPSLYQLIPCLLLFGIGFGVICFLSRMED